MTLPLTKPRVMVRMLRPRAPGPHSRVQCWPWAATLPAEALVLELQAQPGLGDRLTRSTGRVTREEKTQARPLMSVSWTLGPGSGPAGGEAPGLVKVALPVNT